MSIIKTVVTNLTKSLNNVTNFKHFNNPLSSLVHFNSNFNQQPDFALVGISNESNEDIKDMNNKQYKQYKHIELQSLLEGIWLMAVPKSKV